MSHRIAFLVSCSIALSGAVHAQTSCQSPAQPQMDWLGALTGCRPGGVPCIFGERIDFFARPVRGSFQSCDTFAWGFGDGGHASMQNPSHTYLSTGNFQVNLGVSNRNGATSTSAQVVVIATAPPLIDEFSASSRSVAPGQTVILTWRTRLVHKIQIQPLNYENEQPSGTLRVTPSQTTSYVLIVYGDAGIRQSDPPLTVVVTSPPPRRRAARH